MGKARKRQVQKPTGKLGNVVVGGGQPAQFEDMQFPRTKREIERQVVEAAMAASGAIGGDLWNLYLLTAAPVQNPDEHGPDYILRTKAGGQFLELAEAAPLTKLGGSYDNLPLSYITGERADLVYEIITAKTAKYGLNPRPPMHLLLYATDFRLSLDPKVLDLIGYRASRQPHSFRSIVYFEQDGEGKGNLHVICPRPAQHFDGYDEASSRRMQVLLGDVLTLKPIPNGVVIKLGCPVAPVGDGPVTFSIDTPVIHSSTRRE